MCFFIFFTKAGQYTREEFAAAREQFEKTDKPKIYTYFKVLGEEKGEDNLYAFMDELDKTLGHYYGTFEHIDTVKLRILLNLKLQELDFIEIKAEDGVCTVDGEKTLSLSNVSEFANKLLCELNDELESIESRYFTLKAKYAVGECSASEENEYINTSSKRASLLESIDELKKSIFNMSLRMCQDDIRGDITPRQREVYRLFETGDLDGANAILDFSKIKNEYQRRKAVREAEQKNDARIFIREGKTKIDILTVMVNRASRFDEIEEIYDEITSVAEEEGIELDVFCNFAYFLYEQNKLEKAYYIAKMQEEAFSDDEKTMHLYNAISLICDALTGKTDEAAEYYKKSIQICEKMAKNDPERFDMYLASSYSNFGLFCGEHRNCDEAEKYYCKAIKIYESSAKKNTGAFEAELAACYNNIGITYSKQKRYDLAEKYLKKTIEIRERLAKTDKEKFEPDLATSYNNIGSVYKETDRRNSAEKYYKKAIEIREALAEKNPEMFKYDLAHSYLNYAILKEDFTYIEKISDFLGIDPT